MSQRKLPTLRAFARHNAARLVAATALIMPAAAVAAGPSTEVDPTAEGVALESGPREQLLERISDPLMVAAEDERRERRRERADGPFHPVAAAVTYGSAEAAFGNARGRPHEGQDIFAPAGTTLVAPVDGVVVDGGSDGGRGNWVAIYDPQREQTYSYFHMAGPAAVGPGEKVAAADRVGKLGCTGSCFGDHLHFEIREGRGPYGTAVDPMPLLEKAERAKA